MMYAKLALENVKKSTKDYLIYIVTLTACISMFYAFLSISSNYYEPNIGAEFNLDILGDGIKYAILLITILLMFLMQYVNHFMIQRRKREFAIQSIIGMEQSTIISFAAMFLVIETELFFLAGRLLIPSVSWLVVILLLSPAISLIAITLIVRGSAKAQSVEESQQAAVFLILPVILPIAGQFTGVFLMNVWILLGLGVICAILAWFLLQKSMGRFTYEKLLQ